MQKGKVVVTPGILNLSRYYFIKRNDEKREQETDSVSVCCEVV